MIFFLMLLKQLNQILNIFLDYLVCCNQVFIRITYQGVFWFVLLLYLEENSAAANKRLEIPINLLRKQWLKLLDKLSLSTSPLDKGWNGYFGLFWHKPNSKKVYFKSFWALQINGVPGYLLLNWEFKRNNKLKYTLLRRVIRCITILILTN